MTDTANTQTPPTHFVTYSLGLMGSGSASFTLPQGFTLESKDAVERMLRETNPGHNPVITNVIVYDSPEPRRPEVKRLAGDIAVRLERMVAETSARLEGEGDRQYILESLTDRLEKLASNLRSVER